MKKICFITTVSMTLNAFVLPTAKMLYETGNYDITFICNDDDNFGKTLPPYVHFRPISIDRGISFDGLKVVRQLRNIFREEKFDIVQYSTPNASFYASIAAKKERVSIRLYAQWGIRYVGFKGLKRKLFKFIEKKTCRNSTTVWSVSKMNRQFGIDEKLYSENKAKLIGRGGTVGVDISAYDLSKKNEYAELIRKELDLGGKFVFAFVGRLTADKGQKELAYAFDKIAKEFQDVRLLVIGDQDTTAGNKISDFYFNNSYVKLIGKKPNDEIKKYLSATDVLVHPTYREGFGLVLQEAGAMQIAVLTTDIPGAGEVFENGKSCLLAKAKDGESLYLYMKRLYLNAGEREILAENAREMTEKYYDRRIMLKNQLEFYEGLSKKKC